MYPIVSFTKRMTRSMRCCFLFLFLVQLLPSTTALSRDWVKIKSTNQSIKLVDMFLFEKRGGVDLWVSNITFTSSSNSDPIATPNIHDLSKMGFYLSPRGTKGAELLKQYDKDKSFCYLHSDIGGSKKIIYTLDKLEGTNQFNTSKEFQIESGYYSLLFENCIPNVEVSMSSSSGMYNLDGSGSRHYSNWWTNICSITVYPLFIFLYVVVWCWFDRDSTRILNKSCNLVGCFTLRLMFLPTHIVSNFAIDLGGYPVVLAFNWMFANIALGLLTIKMLLFLQSGCASRLPLQLSRKEKELGCVACLAIIMLFTLETYSSLEPCDAYRMGCFLRLNAIRCARSFAVILMLYTVWKDNTDNVCVKLTKSLTVLRSNLLFFTLLSYFGVLHFSSLLSMFPSTSAASIALDESANLALFVFIYCLYLPPPSAQVDDDDLEARLINSLP